jgi:hypothetical protein
MSPFDLPQSRSINLDVFEERAALCFTCGIFIRVTLEDHVV